MNRRERTLVVAALAAGLLAGAAWGGVRRVSAADAAAAAARDLAECERLARRIDDARGESSPVDAEAAPRDAGVSELNRRIDAAARAAELPEGSVGLIASGVARRLGDGPLMEHPTGVQLSGVALRQLFRFLHSVAGEDARVGLKSIRLTAPPGEAGELWNVEATLTQTTAISKDSAARRPPPAGR